METEDFSHLTRELDITKSRVFLSKKNAAFLGSLMCTLDFQWTRSLPTAGTDGKVLQWNPDYYEKLPKGTNLNTDSRATDLQHELWHVALLHQIRRGARNAEIWNIACDIRIDLMLEAEGCSFIGIDGVPRDKKYLGWAEEDIYDDLINNNPPTHSCTCCSHTMPISDANKQNIVNNVVQAIQQAKLAGQAGNLPGAIQETINKFLEPVIPWQTLLMKFFTDLMDEDYTWARPNRRYQDIYLPSKFTDDGRLEHLVYFLDVSGSTTDKELLRFNSEVKYVQETLKPRKLTMVQFDTMVQDVKEFVEDEPFDEIHLTGRGGTSFEPVKQYIEKHKPTAAIIFSDMECAPMDKPNIDIPIIWCISGNYNPPIHVGKAIRIKD